MIKFMDRSIWYFIKRPLLTWSLVFSEPSVRLYSIFVMDLIESDMLEYKVRHHMMYSRYWFVRDTQSVIDTNRTNFYIDSILSKKSKKIKDKEKMDQVKNDIAKHFSEIKPND